MMTSLWHLPSPVEDADVAIAYGSAEQTGRRVTLLGHSRFFPVCSPRLPIAHQGNLRPKDMLDYTIIHEHNTDTWMRWFINCGVVPSNDIRSIYFDGAGGPSRGRHRNGDMPTVGADLLVSAPKRSE